MAELCPIRPVGPLVPPSLLGEEHQNDVVDGGISMWKADETSLEWLNNQLPASVIYVSFGSLLYLPAKLMEAIATALKNSNRPFLWVVKQPEFPLSDGAAGIPVIAFPQWTDQPTNAKLIVDVFKVGLRVLNSSHPDGGNVFVKEEQEKCITKILCGPKSEELKKNALKLKQAAHEAVSSGGSSDWNIQLFVDEISGN
ncbi:UDP-glucuronosyl/UDP-glucosyltransferase [Corchorus capsularis]|uniref:UDP-glucuronosyl/UDP-glucosyltransferase n=1 Tax=Corchorus capsularis TaxID=210143 RepID=A0A1R3HUI7_COCAP|nr:UDP-glucuronosyl/UDP-glucosyltransferase [Corchorus capsularis]